MCSQIIFPVSLRLHHRIHKFSSFLTLVLWSCFIGSCSSEPPANRNARGALAVRGAWWSLPTSAPVTPAHCNIITNAINIVCVRRSGRPRRAVLGPDPSMRGLARGEDYFPEMVKRIVVVRAPRVFYTVWRRVGPPRCPPSAAAQHGKQRRAAPRTLAPESTPAL